MTTWKYKAVTLKAGMVKYSWKDDALEDLSIEEGLNKLGHEGWELVTTAPYTSSGITTEIVFIFKKLF